MFFVQGETGSHINFKGTIYDTIVYAVEGFGMKSLQFFMGNPMQAYKRSIISKDDIEKSRKITDRFELNVFTHYPYCINLASDDLQHFKIKNSLKALEYELNVISNFKTNQNKTGVVIHVGSHKDKKLGHKLVAQCINNINFKKNAMLLIENSAAEGNKLTRTISEIKSVMNMVNENKRENVGVCWDTCHGFGSGEYNFSEISEVDRFFSEFDEIIGLEKLKLIHLNNSREKFGSRKDRHAGIFRNAYIWFDENRDVLFYLLTKLKYLKIPFVLETSPLELHVLNKLCF